jgi:hypothetical protein
MYLILKNDFSNLLDHSVTQCILGTYTASIKNQSITDTTPHTNKMDAHKYGIRVFLKLFHAYNPYRCKNVKQEIPI